MTDTAGNPASDTETATLDFSVSGLTSDITDATNSGSNDDTITNDATPDISGVTEAGATVTITYTDATGTERKATGMADSDGKYTIAITNALKEGSTSLSITAVDVAGNDMTTTQDVTVDTSVSGLTSDITDATNSGSNDDTITNDATPDISGVTEAGATVTITYMDATGTEHTATGTADADGKYTIAITNALAEGSTSLSITAVDVAGNETTTTQDVTVDTSIVGGVNITQIASDFVVNSDESSDGNLVTVIGYVTNDAVPGDDIAVSLDGVVIGTGKVSDEQDGNGHYIFSINVLGSDLAATASVPPVIVVTVSGQDIAGNSYVAQDTESYSVDTFTEVDISLSEASGDYIVNYDEVGNLTVEGLVELDASVTSITITDVNGNSITFTEGVVVTSSEDGYGQFETNVDVSTLADGDLSVVVVVTDAAGNTVSSEPTVILKDTVATAGTVTIDPITADDVINASEADADTVTISGKATGGDIAEGDTVTMTIGENTYTTKVGADGTWSVDVAGSDLAADTGFDVVVTSDDAAGNKVESTGYSEYTVDLNIALPSITFEDAGTDGIYNADEVGDDNTITATISVAGSEVGDKLTYSVNGTETTITLDANNISNGVAIEVSPGAEVTATLSDAAGNSSSEVNKTAADADVSVAPPIITSVTDDSAASDYSKVTLHGTGEVGAVITLWVIANSTTAGNDTQTGEYTELTSVTTTVSSDGTWSLDVSSLSETPVNDNEFFKVTQTDAAGNVSGGSNIVHYWHGDWTSVSSETGDDFVLLGSGNDTIQVDADDYSNSLTVDGGAGNDTAVFSAALSDMQSITLDDAGNVIIVDDYGDTNTFIDFESFSFDGDTYTKDELFAPHAHDDEATTDEDSGAITIAVLANDVDFDSPTLTITGADVSASQGTVTIVDGKLEFTPAANFNGEATITYSVSDGTTTDTATVSVTVNAVDDAVDAVNDSVTVAEDGSITLNLIDNDSAPDGGLEVTAINGVELTGEAQTISVNNGSVVIAATGEMTFEPAADFSGDISFNYDVKDADGSTDTATVSVTVNAVADAPIITESSNSSSPGIAYSFWSGVYAGDANGDGVADFDGNGASVEQLTALLESTQNTRSPEYSGVIGEISSINGIQQGTLAVATTYVYLEAGSSYSFSGNADDSFYVKVGGGLVAEAQWDNGNTAIESTVLTVSESGYYPVEIAYHNQNGDGFIHLAVSINGGDSQVFGTDSFSMYPTSTIPNVGEAVYEEDGVTVDHYLMLNSGYEDSSVQLEAFTISLADQDGSETLNTVLSGAPEGTIITIDGKEYVFDENETVDVGNETDFTNVTLQAPENYNGTFTVSLTATATETSNADTAEISKDILVTVYAVNDAPVISITSGDSEFVTVSEEGLENGNSDSEQLVEASGTVSISDIDSATFSMSLVAPTAVYTSNGVEITWAINGDGDLVGSAGDDTIVTISITDVVDGKATYTATLTGSVDHADPTSEDSLSIDFGIVATDGSGAVSTQQNVSVVIEDDAPDAVTTTVEMQLENTTFTYSIGNISSGFSSTYYYDNNNDRKLSGISAQDTDSDSYDDSIVWGKSSSSDKTYSSISISEGSSSHNVLEGSEVVVASLTHRNNETSKYDDSLAYTDLNIDVTLTIDGQLVSVSLASLLKINETVNNNNTGNGDTLTLSESSANVEVNGVSYKVYLDGFLVNNSVTSTVTTAENAIATYSIVAHAEPLGSSSDTDTNTITGTLLLDAGADGLAYVVASQNGFDSTVSNGASTVTNENGMFTVNEDGTYSFTASDSLYSSLGAGESKVVSYEYSVVDSDGDSVRNTINITVTGSDSSSSTTLGLTGSFYNVDHQLGSIAVAESVIATQSANATFISTVVNYQSDTSTSSDDDLGGVSSSGRTHLADWLGDDSRTIDVRSSDNTNDAVISLVGGVSLAAGTYSIKVNADDGYQITIGGVVVASYDANTSTQANTYTFTVTENGVHSIDIVYWDQGGDYTLQVSLDDGSGYEVLGSDSYPTYSTYTVDDGVQTFFEGLASDYESRMNDIKTSAGDKDTDNVSSQGAANVNISHTDQSEVDGDTSSSGTYNAFVDGLYSDTDTDSTIIGTSNNDFIDGRNGDDSIEGGNSQDTLIGGTGDDWLKGGDGDDTLIGGSVSYSETHHGYSYTIDESGSGNDILDGGAGNDRLIAGDGDDFLLGGDGTDTLFGGDGNDVLIGGQGQDTMTGGAGQDLFILTDDGVDTITDFNSSEDALDISDLLTLPSDVNSADQDAVTAYLNQHVEIKDGKMKVDGDDVVSFGTSSDLDSNDSGSVTTADSIKVIYNDQEYNINIDG